MADITGALKIELLQFYDGCVNEKSRLISEAEHGLSFPNSEGGELSMVVENEINI